MIDQQEEIARRRKQRNWVVAGLLIGMCALFYFITLARIGG
jgi:hypothetical protein